MEPSDEGPGPARCGVLANEPDHETARPAVRGIEVGGGPDDLFSCQSPKVLPVGKPARLRRVWRLARSRPAASSASRTRTTSAGSQRWAFAVGMMSVSDRRMWGSLRAS